LVIREIDYLFDSWTCDKKYDKNQLYFYKFPTQHNYL